MTTANNLFHDNQLLNLKTKENTSHCQQLIVLWTLCLALLSMVAAPAAGLDVELGSAKDELTLPIGEDLVISWEGAPPDSLLKLILSDEEGTLIAHRLATSSEGGSLAPTNLWKRTGVVGCDPCSDPDPLTYRYSTFAEAEVWLPKRQLTLSILDHLDITLRKVTLEPKPVLAERFYFSDGAGCPRSCFDQGEALYLVGENVRSRPWPIRFFLVDAPHPLPSEIIEEIRPSYEQIPQEVLPAGTDGSFIELLAPANQAGRRAMTGVVRADSDSIDYVRLPDDTIPLALHKGIPTYAFSGIKEDALEDEPVGPCDG